MNGMTRTYLLAGAAMWLAMHTTVAAQYPGWQHDGSFYILTTPEGANLPATASEQGFPLLVRLTKDSFDFSQAKSDGADLRFAAAGKPLVYQIETWDATAGAAAIWVRIPVITGNAQQELNLYWGKLDATSESNGPAVFNQSNGHAGVLHLAGPDAALTDEVGALMPANLGTTAVPGIIGQARHFEPGQAIQLGDHITGFPVGASPHTTGFWFKTANPSGGILTWGDGQRESSVPVELARPLHLRVIAWHSSSFVESRSTLPLAQWAHVVYTYQKGKGASQIYVNGRLDGVTTRGGNPPLTMPGSLAMSLGGWQKNFKFTGELDEVRVSNVVRSADWIRLEYENQKALQTLVGTLVRPGNALEVAPAAIKVAECESMTVTATAEGARKMYWILKRDGTETIAAVDQASYTLEAGRVTGDTSYVLQFKAVYADCVKTKDIPVTVMEQVPEPVFTLNAPAKWNGRNPIEVVATVTNREAMAAKGVGELTYQWSVAGGAVIQEVAPSKLILKRSQYSGPITVMAAIHNGGAAAVVTTPILVTEPLRDPWVQRTPAADEKPEDNQFYARDDHNQGTLHYNGTLDAAADTVFLKVYADDKPYTHESRKPATDHSYAFAVKLKPGLVHYKVEFGTMSGATETVLQTVSNIVCGDAYLIDGQSNAVATSWGKEDFPETSDWIRSFGSMGGDPKRARWGNAIRRAPADRLTVGYWPFDLAKRLVAAHQLPICIINGAVGGTMICEHLRNPANPADLTTIYGRLLWRVQQARLTHGIRGLLWHQGEADQGTLGPTGDYNYKSYHQNFVELSAAWKQDYPNLAHYYIYQIWPNACTDPSANDMLREVQRTLPRLYSNMRIMSTLGIVPGSSCHYLPAGYEKFAELIGPLVEQDNYGQVPAAAVTAPDLRRAGFTTAARNEIALEFGQEMAWNNGCAALVFLDGVAGKVASGSASGKVIKLQLTEPSAAGTITYLIGASPWVQGNLIYGANGIAALTFCQVPILPGPPPAK
jgi:hypothetical protein